MPTAMPDSHKGAAPHGGHPRYGQPHADRSGKDWIEYKIEQMKRKHRECDLLIGGRLDSRKSGATR